MKLHQTSANSSQIQGLRTLYVLSLELFKTANHKILLGGEVQQESRLVCPFWSESEYTGTEFDQFKFQPRRN